MPVGNPSNGVGLFAGQVMLTSSSIFQNIYWYHDPTQSEPDWQHRGKFYSSIFVPEVSVGLTDNFNISISQIIGLRWMQFNPEFVGEGVQEGNFTSDHHRDESSLTDFTNARGGIFGDMTLKGKYLLSYTSGGEGSRSFISMGLVIPSKNSLTSDPYFQKKIDHFVDNDGNVIGNGDGYVSSYEASQFNTTSSELIDKSHKHFSISEGVYRISIEPSYFYKRRFNPVFLGISLNYSIPIKETTFSSSTYKGGANTEIHFTSLFVSNQISLIRNFFPMSIDFSLGFTLINMEPSSWDSYSAVMPTSTVILPSFGVLYGTEKYGAFNFILRTSYYLRGGFPSTSEFENTKFNQEVNELSLIINYRLPVDYYISWLE